MGLRIAMIAFSAFVFGANSFDFFVTKQFSVSGWDVIGWLLMTFGWICLLLARQPA